MCRAKKHFISIHEQCVTIFAGRATASTETMKRPIGVSPFGCAFTRLVLCLLISHSHPSFALDIYVNQRNGTAEDCCRQGETCLTLNLALDCLRQNNHTTVWIEPDTYYLNATDGGDEEEFNWMQDIAIVALSEELEMDTSEKKIYLFVWSVTMLVEPV